MGQSTKAVCTLVSIGSATAAAIGWTNDRPDAAAWGLRIGGLLVALLALGTILKLHFRVDRERDYLRQISERYFNRDGFCFAFAVSVVDGVAFLNSYFQTQRDQSCIAQIVLRPARGFFMTRAKIDLIAFAIECPPAGFGYARIAIPKEMQGKLQSFEVGASVRYPNGHGKRRFFAFKHKVPQFVSHRHNTDWCRHRVNRPLASSNGDDYFPDRR